MINRNFGDIIQMTGGSGDAARFGHIQIRGVSTDSRSIAPGCLFVPLSGEKFDGHAYVKEALERGAAAALWAKDRAEPPADLPLVYVEDTLIALQELARAYRSTLPVRIIGVTGSNGKTTTKDMVASVLATTYKVHKTKGNFNNHIGLPLTILSMEEDTEMAVVEMGMSGRGEIEFLSRLAKPEAAIITNIGESHLLQLGSREEIARAKTEIVLGLRPDGLIVYNGDEPLIDMALSELKLGPELLRFRFGSGSDNDFYPLAILQEEEGIHFTLNTPNSPNYYIPLLGTHNVINALACIAVSKYMGVSEQDIILGLERLEATGMRVELVQTESGIAVINDAYNASPTSMKAALALLSGLKGYRHKFAVLGDMLELGATEEELHRGIGRELGPSVCDYVYTYGKLASAIAEEAKAAFPSGRVKAFQSKDELMDEMLRVASAQDVVLVKGSRGMKLEDVVNQLKNSRLME